MLHSVSFGIPKFEHYKFYQWWVEMATSSIGFLLFSNYQSDNGLIQWVFLWWTVILILPPALFFDSVALFIRRDHLDLHFCFCFSSLCWKDLLIIKLSPQLNNNKTRILSIRYRVICSYTGQIHLSLIKKKRNLQLLFKPKPYNQDKNLTILT